MRMSIRDERREAAIERMANHLLLEGLGAATLRPLAAAAGTSDRMLLYYFADKNELLSATLHRLAARMTAQLDEAVPIGRLRSFPVLVEEVWAAFASGGVRPFMHLWLDLVAGAARGLQPHHNIAGAIADGFLAWVMSRLKAPRGSELASSAALFLASIEGLLFLQAAGRISDAAVTELAALSKRPR
jgi:AcrR family transcriptional regulator